MPNLFDDNYYICSNCGGNTFYLRRTYVLRKDAPHMLVDDCNYTEAEYISCKYKYFCIECNILLKRGKGFGEKLK